MLWPEHGTNVQICGIQELPCYSRERHEPVGQNALLLLVQVSGHQVLPVHLESDELEVGPPDGRLQREVPVAQPEQLAADEERRRVEVEVEAAAEPPPEFFRLRVKNVGADDLAVSQSDGARAPDLEHVRRRKWRRPPPPVQRKHHYRGDVSGRQCWILPPVYDAALP